MKAIYLHASNPQNESVTLEVTLSSHIKQALSFLMPRTCPYTNQIRLDVSLQVQKNEQDYPKTVRMFGYKFEEYNQLHLYTIAYPDIENEKSVIPIYKSFTKHDEAMYYLHQKIYEFIRYEDGWEKCFEETY